MDLYEVSPESEDGCKVALTLHCVYSRYPCLRKLKNTTTEVVSDGLVDVFFDVRVVPVILLSGLGREFTNEILTELVQLLRSALIFSSAVHLKAKGSLSAPTGR